MTSLRASRRLLVILAAFGAAAAPARGADRIHPFAGTSSAVFLKEGIGARAVGMGEAFTAVADDAQATYWNPAGLAGQQYSNLSFMHQEAFQGIKHEFLGFARPISGMGRGDALGLSVNSLFVPSDLERRSGLNENDHLNALTASQGTFGAYDLALGASYARFAGQGERQAWGGTLKYIRQTIDNTSGQSVAADFGWRLQKARPGLDLGAAILNLGPGVAVGSTRYPLPLTVRLGAGYHLPRQTLLAFDVSKPRDDYPLLAFGAETQVLGALKLRAGYRYRWYGNPLGLMAGLRAGMGVVLSNFSLDYAFAPFGELGNAHRLSIGWKFGVPRAAPKASAPERVAPAAIAAAPVVPLPPPLPAPVEGYEAFSVKALPKTVSSRGTDYQIRAAAPSAGWLLRAIEFRAQRGSTPEGLSVAVTPAAADPKGKIFRFKLSFQPRTARAVVFSVTPPEGSGAVSVLGLFGGEWRPLTPEPASGGEARTLRFSTDTFPEELLIASPHGPEPDTRR